ncbi:MAG: hypothetical protein WEG36_13740 [Gemmatimonadota bacterium]
MSESLDQEIRTLRAQFWSARDPEGRAFAPLAEAYRRLGDLDEATSLVRDGLDRLPDFSTGHLVASRVARDRGDLLLAREHLDRVLDLDPENVLALLERADARASEADGEGAAFDLKAALELEPENAAALGRLADLEDSRWATMLEGGQVGGPGLPSQGDPAPPPTPPPDIATGSAIVPAPERVPADGEDREEAEEDEFAARMAAEEESDEETFLMTRTMAELYAKQGLHERAVEVYVQLVEANPDDAGLAERLSELETHAFEETEGEEERPPARLVIEDIEEEEEEEGPGVPPSPLPSAAEVAMEVEGVGEVWLEVEVVEEEAIERTSLAPTTRESGPRTIAEYLGDLLAWVPGAVPVASLAPDGLEGSSVPPAPLTTAECDPDEDAEGAHRDEGDTDGFDAWLRSLRS